MQLREAIEKYLQVAGGYGKPVPLAAFGLSQEDTARLFSVLDEDYHISRFFNFRMDAGESYLINGFPQTHISIDAEVQSIL
jgi:hypothetical protein